MGAHRSMRAADDLPKEMRVIRRPSRIGHAGSEHPSTGKSLEVIMLSAIATGLSKLYVLSLGLRFGTAVGSRSGLVDTNTADGRQIASRRPSLGSAIAIAPVDVDLDQTLDRVARSAAFTWSRRCAGVPTNRLLKLGGPTLPVSTQPGRVCQCGCLPPQHLGTEL